MSCFGTFSLYNNLSMLHNHPNIWPVIEWNFVHVTFLYNGIVPLRSAFEILNQTSRKCIQSACGLHQGSQLLGMNMTWVSKVSSPVGIASVWHHKVNYVTGIKQYPGKMHRKTESGLWALLWSSQLSNGPPGQATIQSHSAFYWCWWNGKRSQRQWMSVYTFKL